MARCLYLFRYGRQLRPSPFFPTAMTTATPSTAPSTAEQKKAAKAEKQRLNRLNNGLGDLCHALGADLFYLRERVEQTRRSLVHFPEQAPTQAVAEFLTGLDALLAQAEQLGATQGKQATAALSEHLFPGRAARQAERDEQDWRDRSTSQNEQYAGYSRA